MSSKGKILVVDDDVTLLQLMEFSLSDVGYEVECVSSGLEALRALFTSPPDLIVLDIAMPEMDGWQVCRRVREMCNIPIIMLTAFRDQESRIKGLELGADDYLGKPFDIRELMLRIEAILRRTKEEAAGGLTARSSRCYDDGRLFVDIDNRIVQYEGTPISLTPYEFDLLSCFVRQPNKALAHEYLLRQVWGLDPGGNGRDYVKAYIRLLRQKIEPDPAHPRYVITEWGVGYRLAGSKKKRSNNKKNA